MPKKRRCEIHKYKKVKNYSKTVYRCLHCSHYLLPEMLEGQLALCNKCEEPFEISASAARLTKPVCDRCRKGKRMDFDKDAVKAVLKSV